jgi:branched-chain amino acid transport system ATP-binding protein
VLVELRDEGVSIIVAEEKVRDILTIADDVMVLELGRLAWSGRADARRDGDRLAEAYLGMVGASDGPAPQGGR